MAPTSTPKAGQTTVKYLRIATPGPAVRIEAAGAFWAGISEVPAASLTPTQIELLRKTEGITVSEAEDRPAEAD